MLFLVGQVAPRSRGDHWKHFKLFKIKKNEFNYEDLPQLHD